MPTAHKAKAMAQTLDFKASLCCVLRFDGSLLLIKVVLVPSVIRVSPFV